MISFKKIDNSNISVKIKSTNTFTNNKIKSINGIKRPGIPSIKQNKKIVLIMKDGQNNPSGQNNISMNGKKNKKEIKSNHKGANLRKVFAAQKITKTLFRNKTENKIEHNTIKNKLPEINRTPTPVKKKIKKVKKPLMNFISDRNKKEKKFINTNPKNSIQHSFLTQKKTHNILKDDIITMQNTRKNTKIAKRENNTTSKKKCVKKERKFSFDVTKSNHNLSLSEITINNKYYSPSIKHLKKFIKKEYENKELNEDKKYMKIKNSLSLKERDINKDKQEIINKLNKKTFKNMFYGNKGKTMRDMRDKLIFLSKNIDNKDNNRISYTNKLNETVENSISKIKEFEEFRKIDNNTFKKIMFMNRERNSTCDKLNTKRNSNIDKFDNYLNTDNKVLVKKISQNINKSSNHNYLKYTICAFNKMINKKKEKEKEINTPSTEHKKSKTMDKDINSIKKRNKDKYVLFHRNTITKFKLKEKNTDKSNNISNSNFSTSNTSRTSLRKIDEYSIIKELGKGSYASVKLAFNKVNKNKYAIKVYSKKALSDPQKKDTVNNEIALLKQIDNINIVKLYEVIDSPTYLYLVMEYIDGVSLLDTIKRDENHYFEEQKALKLFLQIIKAILYCQKKNICHRDIKLENILITKDETIKIIDFGFAVKTDKETYQNLLCGSPSYMAPEIVKKEKYIAQFSDIWSLGVLLYSMLYGRFPFKGKTQEELFQKINEAKVEFPEDIEVNDKIKILLKKIFVVFPTQRPSLQEILNEILLLIN
jgi:hypothetical protein